VFAQTRLPQEIIVVDDASPDHTGDVVAAIAAASRIPLRLIRLSTNCGGPAHPMNVGITAATGDLIAVLDQGDVFTPTKLARQVGTLEAHPELSFVFSLSAYYDHPEITLQIPSMIRDVQEAGQRRADFFWLDASRALGVFMKWENPAMGFPGFV